MRILHTADWHLGRFLHGQSLLDDQAHILAQLVALAAAERVDAVVVAGDVYDRSQPAADAVALLDEVLTRLVIEARIPVVLIAGNHDSAERIHFGSRMCRDQGLHLRGTLGDLAPVVLRDAHGEVAVCPVPYVEPIFARALPGGETIRDHDGAMRHVLAAARARLAPGQRSVLVAHAFVAGGHPSDSERPLSVGGSGAVAADAFAGFDLVALGHLHRPQPVGAARIYYAGSPLKYSFAESDHLKSVALVDLDAAGRPTIRTMALAPRRDVRVITGTLAELVTRPDPTRPRDDYLCALLTDPGPVLEPMARLRAVYPYVLDLQFARPDDVSATARAAGDYRRRPPADLFQAFYRDVQGAELDEPQLAAFTATVGALGAGDGEGTA